MARGSGIKEERVIPPETVQKIVEHKRSTQDAWIHQCLVRSFNRLTATLNSGDKIKNDDNCSLVTRMVGLIDTVCGLHQYDKMRTEQLSSIMSDVVNERDLFCQVVTARHKIEMQNIIIESQSNEIKRLKAKLDGI